MNAMRAIFLLGGIAIFVVGTNGRPPLMVVGAGLVVLALVAGMVSRSRAGGGAGAVRRDAREDQ